MDRPNISTTQAVGIGAIMAKMGEVLSCGIELVQPTAISPNPKSPRSILMDGPNTIITQAVRIGVIMAKMGEALS